MSYTLDELIAECDARIDRADLPGDLTERARDEYIEKTADMIRRRTAAVAARTILTDTQKDADFDAHWVSMLQKWREPLCTEILAIPPHPRTDHDRGNLLNVTLSIKVIDRGKPCLDNSGYMLETLKLAPLMLADGYKPSPPPEGQIFGRLPWYGGLTELETRMRRREKQRTIAKAQFEDALLDDAERAARVAAAKAQNAKPQRKTRGDGSQYWKHPDGHIEEIDLDAERQRADAQRYQAVMHPAAARQDTNTG